MNPYKIIWYGFKFGNTKRIYKYITKGTHAFVIGNVVLVLKHDFKKIDKNISQTRFSNPHRFTITDKQMGLIAFTNHDFTDSESIEEWLKYRKCTLPQLVVNDSGKLVLIPVTNMQFIGTTALQRKTIWL